MVVTLETPEVERQPLAMQASHNKLACEPAKRATQMGPNGPQLANNSILFDHPFALHATEVDLLADDLLVDD